MKQITRQEIVALVQLWRERAEEQGYRKGSREYARYEIEFFIGAMAMLVVLGNEYPMAWAVVIQSGRSVSDTLNPPENPSNN